MASLIPTSSPPIPGTPSLIPGAPSNVPPFGSLSAPASVHLRSMDGRFVNKGFGFEWHNLTALMNQPEKFGEALLARAETNMEHLAVEIEQYAKDHAPWSDRTGGARESLHAIFRRGNNVYEIDLGYGVPYGYYLEHANGGAYAVVQPTLEHFAPAMADLAKASTASATNHAIPGGFE